MCGLRHCLLYIRTKCSNTPNILTDPFSFTVSRLFQNYKIVPICGTKLRVHDFQAVQLCNDKRYRKGSVNPLRWFSCLFDSQSGLKYCSWGFRSDEKNEYDYSDRLLLFSHFTKLTLNLGTCSTSNIAFQLELCCTQYSEWYSKVCGRVYSLYTYRYYSPKPDALAPFPVDSG